MTEYIHIDGVAYPLFKCHFCGESMPTFPMEEWEYCPLCGSIIPKDDQ